MLKRRKELAIIDSSFPRKEPRAFRNAEINEYLKRLKNVSVYAMPYMRNEGAWFPHGYGVDKSTFKDNLTGYLGHYPENKGRIHYLNNKYIKRMGLAYSFFLAETYTLLPYYEKHKIPFVFVLYPGGSFGIDYEESDRMLREVFSSKWFRGVIVTQKITKDYLLSKELCPADQIDFIYGGFVQFDKQDVRPKLSFPENKKTFDICFVAAKNIKNGDDKGYDLFVDTAKLLNDKYDFVRFHVIGGFDKDDLDVASLGSNITFYGFRPPSFLVEFYRSMDVYLTPNRPGRLWEGNFDGFPLGADAQYCGVALFTSDELGMNTEYVKDKDIVVIQLNARKISSKISHYIENPTELYKLSEDGQKKAQSLWGITYQIDRRLEFFGKRLNLIRRERKR